MRILWSVPVRGEPLSSSRGDLVRARMLIGALRSQGHQIHIVAASDQTAAEFTVSAYRGIARNVLPEKAALIARDLGRWLHGRAHGARVAQAARAFKAEAIVETQVNYALSGVVAAEATGLPLLLDDCAPISEEEELGAGLPSLARRILRRQFSRAAVATVPSRALRDRFVAEGAPADKLLVVPNGVDPGAYRDRRAELRRECGLEEVCVLGFVGSFQPWHRVELLVGALAAMRERLPLHVVLIGDGPGLASVRAKVKQSGLEGRFTFLGAADSVEVPSLLSMLDIGILPGANDYSHPMKLLEYGAAGLPSIAPDVAPVREIIRQEEHGLLVPPGDMGALCAAVARLAGDAELRARLGAAARKQVVKEASWDDRARSIVAALAKPTENGAASGSTSIMSSNLARG